RLVRGGGVCWVHGGAAPQVRAKREQRVAEAELLAEAKADPTLPADASPAEVLLHAMTSAHRVLLRLQSVGMGTDYIGPTALDLLGTWIDRASKAASVVVSSKADELRIRQAERVAEAQARQVVDVIARVLSFLDLTEAQEARLPEAMAEALDALGLLTPPGPAPVPAARPRAPQAPLGAFPGRAGGRPALTVVAGEVQR
ncbi:hypothetical protein, partial [Propionicimonas sp.]|uniref:hypothetical protein n=1 Tax=Propionicimonas sp. TaxID=1955623 RepID=UPI0039E5FE86